MEDKILLVEDDADLAEAIGGILTAEGYKVVCTRTSVDAAVRMATDNFAFVILDIQVDELSGGVMRVVSDLAIRAPVIAMSAQTSGWQKDAFRHGASACLRKPFNRVRLLELIEAFRRSSTREIWPGDVRQLSFEDLETLARMSKADLDALPFGVIRLDAERRIDRFNTFEGDSSTFFPPTVIGAKFSDIAPCSAVKEFAQAIEQAYVGEVDRVMRFVFPHHGARVVVSVRIFAAGETGKVWIFVSKARGQPDTNLTDDALGDALPQAPP